MPPDLTDDLKITEETPESILGRLLADTNAGVDPGDPSYQDTVPGSFWDDFNRAIALEHDRVYDRMNEVVAAAIPALSWGSFLDAWARSLGLDRNDAAFAGGSLEFSGPEGSEIAAGAQVSTAQTSVDTDPQIFQTLTGGTIDASGTLTLDAKAFTAGSAGNVPANSVTIPDTPLPTGVTVTNPSKMSGGADVETDESLQGRILRKLASAGGAGNVDDYVNWGLNYPGVGFVTVQANVNGPGTVGVVITDINNDPMPGFAVEGLQQQLDPSDSSAQGKGVAPVGATVTVSTPATTAVTVAATVEPESGYTLDGAAGTINVAQDVEDSVARYVNRLPADGDVLYNKVLAAIVDVVGVVNVSALSLNGGAAGADVAIDATHVASLTTPITLTTA